MSKNTVRRLEALEALKKEEDIRLRQRRDAQARALACILPIVLGYHLGDLKPGENPLYVVFRTLQYPNVLEYLAALLKALRNNDVGDLPRRHDDAFRRLFA